MNRTNPKETDVFKRFLAPIAAALCFAAAPIASAQQAINLTFASGYPPVFLFLKEMQSSFAEEVNRELAKAGNRHRVNWNFALSGTLAKIPAMLEAMEAGQAEVGHISHLFAPGKLPLQNVDGYAPFSVPDHRTSAKLTEQLMVAIPAIGAQYDKLGLVLLANFALDDYVLLSKKPIATLADLKGLKVGGAGANLNWLAGSGAVGVATTGAAAYNDMKSGVFDALLSPMTFVPSSKYHEVAPYMTKVNFNAMTAGQLVANKAAFGKLPAEVQDAMRKAAATFQTRYLEALDRQVAEAEKAVVAGGGKVSVFPREERAKWAQALPNIAEKWARELDARGLPGSQTVKAHMDILRKMGVTPPRAWDQF